MRRQIRSGYFPPQPYFIDWSNPLTNGLVWATLPGHQSSIELVDGGKQTFLTSGSYGHIDPFGGAVYSSSTSNGGSYYPWSKRLETITNTYSVVVWAKFTSFTDFGHIFNIPYHSNWSGPYSCFRLFRWLNTNKLAFSRAKSGTLYNAVSSNDLISTSDPLSMFGSIGTDSLHDFYKNGSYIEQVNDSSGSGNIDWGNKREIALFNRNSGDTGEGLGGYIPFLGIWNRRLTPYEMLWLYLEPYAILLPQYHIHGFGEAGATPATVYPFNFPLLGLS